VNVHVPQAGNKEFSVRVDDPGVLRRFNTRGRPRGGDVAVLDDYNLVRRDRLSRGVDDGDVGERESLRNNPRRRAAYYWEERQ
jgi:hypothetical protein